jgi:hypothetical protein
MSRSALLLLALAGLLALAPRARAAQCAENRDYYQSLPTVIGKEDNVSPFGFVLKCDTVFVRKGVTTIIHPGTMLYFASPSLNSVIKVEGTLIVKGTKTSYVYLSGSLDTATNGTRQPGARQWGGIEVAETGRLEMEYAGVVRAPTPITAFSNQVRIVNSFFKGSSGIILPDGSLMPLEISWHAVNDLDLRKGARDRKPEAASGEKSNGGISREEKAALLEDRKAGFWTWKKAAGGAAAIAVVAVGAAYLGGDETGNSPPKNPPKKLDNRDPIDLIPFPRP